MPMYLVLRLKVGLSLGRSMLSPCLVYGAAGVAQTPSFATSDAEVTCLHSMRTALAESQCRLWLSCPAATKNEIKLNALML